MKHLIKLLSVLLCIVMLLAACDKTSEGEDTTANEADVFESVTETETTETTPETETETEPETEPDTHAYVEPLLGNFFGFEYAENWTTINPDTLKRLDADAIIDYEHPVLVYVKRDVDTKNTVTETFTAYNLELGKVVLEASHSYTNSTTYVGYNGDFVPFDEDGKPAFRYPESMMNVEIGELDGEIRYLMVTKYEFTVVDEATREANPDGSYYTVKKTYEYYDIAGTPITTANHEVSISEVTYDNYSTTYRFGTCNVAFDDETGLALSIVDASGVKQFGKYDKETALYGYLLDRDTFTDFSKEFLEVYEKSTGKLVQRYYYNSAADSVNVWVLRNGDILVQELVLLDVASTTKPNLSFMGMNFTLTTYILDVETGVLTQAEFGYLVYELDSRDDFAEDYELDQAGITLTENAVNIALVYPIDEKAQLRMESPALLVLDNDLEIMFTLESIVLEQDMGRLNYGDLGIYALKDGHYLISLYTGAPAPYVIVDSKGEIVSYISDDMIIADQYIITEDGVYSYKMELQFDFTAGEYELVDVIGHKVIVSCQRTVSTLNNAADATRYPYDDLLEFNYTMYYSLDLTAETLIPAHFLDEDDNYFATYEESIYVSDDYGSDYRIDITHYDQRTYIYEITDDYMITYDSEAGKYTLWNADLTHVLTTDEHMDVSTLDEGKYLIMTQVYDSVADKHIFIAYTVNE